MSNNFMERAHRELEKYLDEHGSEDMSEDEMNDLLQQFMSEYNSRPHDRLTDKTAKTAEDFVELAEEADEMFDKSNAFRYAKKAFKLDKDNLDAERLMAENGTGNNHDLLNKLKRVIEHGDRLLKAAGLDNDESIGEYWLIHDTRPYMRARQAYLDALIKSGMMKAAAAEGEEIIRLNNEDNLGVRFSLMHLYAYLEDEESALSLLSKYEEHDETQMVLPMTILYYKLGNHDKAIEYLKRTCAINKDFKKFIKGFSETEMLKHMEKIFEHGGYAPFTIEELIMEIHENDFLFDTVPFFTEWASREA